MSDLTRSIFTLREPARESAKTANGAPAVLKSGIPHRGALAFTAIACCCDGQTAPGSPPFRAGSGYGLDGLPTGGELRLSSSSFAARLENCSPVGAAGPAHHAGPGWKQGRHRELEIELPRIGFAGMCVPQVQSQCRLPGLQRPSRQLSAQLCLPLAWLGRFHALDFG